jgi:hypothetical protein
VRFCCARLSVEKIDHFHWFTWRKITDDLHKKYGNITHKSPTNHALQRKSTQRLQTERIPGCVRRKFNGKSRIICALSLINCVWIAHGLRAVEFFVGDTLVLQARNMRHMSANCQWKDVDERVSGNIFANNHWSHAYFAHFPRKNYVNYAKITSNGALLRKLMRKAEFWAVQTLESRTAPIRRTSADS